MNPICGGGHGGGAWWHLFLYLPQTVDGSQLQWATKMLNKTKQQNKHSTHRQQPSSRAEFYSRWKLFSKKNYCCILLLNLPSYLLTTEILGPGWEMEQGLRAQTLSRFPPVHSGSAGAELPPDQHKRGCFHWDSLPHYWEEKQQANRNIGHIAKGNRGISEAAQTKSIKPGNRVKKNYGIKTRRSTDPESIKPDGKMRKSVSPRMKSYPFYRKALPNWLEWQNPLNFASFKRFFEMERR